MRVKDLIGILGEFPGDMPVRRDDRDCGSLEIEGAKVVIYRRDDLISSWWEDYFPEIPLEEGEERLAMVEIF